MLTFGRDAWIYWSAHVDNPTSSQFGPFLIDARERMLRRDGEPVPLTPKAFDVLVALLEKPDS